MNVDNSATLVAIAKNEAKYIAEWIAYNLAVGFDKIIIYSNDSTDKMADIITNISKCDTRVKLINWPSVDDVSPQISAYNNSISMIETEWVSFLDIDEFIVPFSSQNIKDFLSKVDKDISSIHINWRNFGSSHRTDSNYQFVIEAFKDCAPSAWGNHHHFKSIARTKHVAEVHIHDIISKCGRRVLSDMTEFVTEQRGLSNRIVHVGIQINHYQSKTFAEFRQRMLRGDANFPSSQAREHTRERFEVLDRNEERDEKIFRFYDLFIAEYERINEFLQS
jgi:hypothetical protein